MGGGPESLLQPICPPPSFHLCFFFGSSSDFAASPSAVFVPLALPPSATLSSSGSNAVRLCPGMGDMAVSNSIGSNVFDILVGLGLPWALKTLAINYGSDVSVSGCFTPVPGLDMSSPQQLCAHLSLCPLPDQTEQQRSDLLCWTPAGLRLSHRESFISPPVGRPTTAAVLTRPSACLLPVQVLGVHLNKWTLDRRLGFVCLLLYSVFLCFSCLIEYNIFTFVNLPTCRED